MTGKGYLSFRISTYEECLRDIGLAIEHSPCRLKHFSDNSVAIGDRMFEVRNESYCGILSFHVNHILDKAQHCVHRGAAMSDM
jgi:hypothetical protein